MILVNQATPPIEHKSCDGDNPHSSFSSPLHFFFKELVADTLEQTDVEITIVSDNPNISANRRSQLVNFCSPSMVSMGSSSHHSSGSLNSSRHGCRWTSHGSSEHIRQMEEAYQNNSNTGKANASFSPLMKKPLKMISSSYVLPPTLPARKNRSPHISPLDPEPPRKVDIPPKSRRVLELCLSDLSKHRSDVSKKSSTIYPRRSSDSIVGRHSSSRRRMSPEESELSLNIIKSIQSLSEKAAHAMVNDYNSSTSSDLKEEVVAKTA